jgi:hypothetical protein
MSGYYESPVQADERWWMQPGERFALEGLLAQLRPALAVEVGTYEGGSLRRIAQHAGEVHAFDIDPRVRQFVDPHPNAVLHLGDSAETLPAALSEFERSGRHVDFALVDGAHTTAAVLRDAAALLESDACRRTAIVFHDSANDAVREALEALDLPAHPKVALALLDFVPGYLVADGEELAGDGYNGLALVVLDPDRGAAGRAWDAPLFVGVSRLHRAYRDAGRRRWWRAAG